MQGIPTAGAASSSAARVAVATAAPPGNADAFGSGGGGDGLPERPQKTTREVLSACALTLLRLLSFAAEHPACSGPSGSSTTRFDNAQKTTVCTKTGDGTDTTNNDSKVVVINHNDINNHEMHFTRPPSLSQPHSAQHETSDEDVDAATSTLNDNHDAARHHSGGVPDAIIPVVGSCLAHVAQAIDLAAGPRGALESVLTLLLPAAGLLVREQAALTLGAIAEQGLQLLTDLREARDASAAVSSPGQGSGDGGEYARDVPRAMPGEAREGRREGKRLHLWRLFCTGVVGGNGAQVGVDEG